MNRTLIEQLQNNDDYRIFGVMSPDEQKCLEEVGPVNCQFLTTPASDLMFLIWKDLGTGSHSQFYACGIYRIKADYEPKSEYVDLPISQFVTFRTQHDDCVQLGDVATLLAGGHEVIARFRREKTWTKG